MIFVQRLRKMHHPLWQLIKAPAFWRKLHHVYGKKGAFETTGIALVELRGIWSEILPAEIYREENFITQIKDVRFGQKGELNATLSVAEWLDFYRKRLVACVDSRLFFLFYNWRHYPATCRKFYGKILLSALSQLNLANFYFKAVMIKRRVFLFSKRRKEVAGFYRNNQKRKINHLEVRT